MKIPIIKKLNIPHVVNAASKMRCEGRLAKSQNNLTYLNVDDAYIHTLFPLLQDEKITIPDYFGEGGVGAHITVIYPEERAEVNDKDLENQHQFIIHDLVAAEIGPKTYYALLIESPSLLMIRRKYHLSDLLFFKGYSIGFHITIGSRASS